MAQRVDRVDAAVEGEESYIIGTHRPPLVVFTKTKSDGEVTKAHLRTLTLPPLIGHYGNAILDDALWRCLIESLAEKRRFRTEDDRKELAKKRKALEQETKAADLSGTKAQRW